MLPKSLEVVSSPFIFSMMMLCRPKYILLPFFLVFCLSCQEGPGETKPEAPQKEPVEKPEIPTYTAVELNSKAKAETSQWLAFVTAQSEVMDYRKYGAEYAAENAAATLQIMQNLQGSIPQKFRTTPVEARVNVLVTLANVLKQESENRKPDMEKIREAAEKIPMAFGNLKIQLNEVFTKPLEEFRQELGNESDFPKIGN